MNGLCVISPENENITLSDTIPANLHRYKMAGSTSRVTSGSFGQMCFQNFCGVGFEIWYGNYFIKRRAAFKIRNNNERFQLHIPWVNSFQICRKGLHDNLLKSKQFEIFYVPSIDASLDFEPGEYHSFDIHFTPEFLQPYARHCLKLAYFLEKAEKDEAAYLPARPQFLSPEMIAVIHRIIEYPFMEELAGLYFQQLVNELLVLFTTRIAALDEERYFTTAERNQALEVKKIITSDFEEYHTVEQLARMVHLSETKLQMAFKYVFGTTVSDYSRKARLEHSYQLLTGTDYPLRVICTMAGYPDPSNFSVAFKKQYGFWPGYIQKKIKNQKHVF